MPSAIQANNRVMEETARRGAATMQIPSSAKGSELITKFDPIKDRHLWAMWRTEVNGRIADQVKHNEEMNHGNGRYFERRGSDETTYGRAGLASQAPMSRFIHLTESSQELVHDLQGQGNLHTNQFIYYGLPRVSIKSSHEGGRQTASHYTNPRAEIPHGDFRGPRYPGQPIHNSNFHHIGL